MAPSFSREVPRELALQGASLSSRGQHSRGSRSDGGGSQCRGDDETGGGVADNDPALGAVVVYRPSHRKCALCLHFADDWDPVWLAFDKKILMKWGKPMLKSGECSGEFCFYCVKMFCGKFRQVGKYTMAQYKNEVGTGSNLTLHMKMVLVVVKYIIKCGGHAAVPKFDWDAVEDIPCN